MNDLDNFDKWVRAGYPRAYRTACLLLGDPTAAEEAVQEAFLRAWRFRKSIPAGDGRTAWLYRLLINACQSRRRAERGVPSTDLHAALADLPEDVRVAIVLHDFAGLADREIATAVRHKPGTVRAHLSEARRLLASDPLLASWTPTLSADVERQS